VPLFGNLIDIIDMSCSFLYGICIHLQNCCTLRGTDHYMFVEAYPSLTHFTITAGHGKFYLSFHFFYFPSLFSFCSIYQIAAMADCGLDFLPIAMANL
jgi:hypothetical protein